MVRQKEVGPVKVREPGGLLGNYQDTALYFAGDIACAPLFL
jgi:hypothetical protein